MNAVVETSNSAQVPRVANAFGPVGAVSTPNGNGASANALMAREAQDIMVQTMVARANPRDIVRSVDRILNAFTRPALCEDAMYEYSRGGSKVSGLSIRAAEVLAQNYGNLRCGVTELSRSNGQSEVMVYAQDLETGYEDAKRFFVKHWRDTKQGGYQLTDERDIYELVANQGARRKRACILAVIPKDVQDAAEQQINVTMNTRAEVTPEAIKTLLESFAKYGVTKDMIEKKIQRHIEAMQPAQLVQLRRIGVSLRDGMSEPGAWFEVAPAAAEAIGSDDAAKPANKTQAVKDQLRKAAGAKATEATPAKDGGGAAPTDDDSAVDAAINSLKGATDLDRLDEIMDGVRDLFRGRDMPGSIETAYRNRRTDLRNSGAL